MEINEILVKADWLRYVEVLSISITAIGAGVFGWKQFEINKRMKELQDYVAVSIIPQDNLILQIVNVGKINLYIHKWEVGRLNENFNKAVLIPAGANSSISIGLQGLLIGEYDFKMYIADEKDEKYISTGKVIIDPVSISKQPPSSINPLATAEVSEQMFQGQTQAVIKIVLRTFSYKTEKYNWKL